MAIDVQDCIRLLHCFKSRAYMGVNIAEQTGENGYGGYVWTPWIHKFQGDTALHIAIKQKKERALCTLLLLGADITIKNDEGHTPADLTLSILNKDIFHYKLDAYKIILPFVNPKDFHYFDGVWRSYELRGAVIEASKATQAGRQ